MESPITVFYFGNNTVPMTHLYTHVSVCTLCWLKRGASLSRGYGLAPYRNTALTIPCLIGLSWQGASCLCMTTQIVQDPKVIYILQYTQWHMVLNWEVNTVALRSLTYYFKQNLSFLFNSLMQIYISNGIFLPFLFLRLKNKHFVDWKTESWKKKTAWTN